jgi:transposase
LPEEQLQFGLEEAEQREAAEQANSEEEAPAERQKRAARRANRGALPTHLPRIETLVDVTTKTCPGWRSALHLRSR